MSAASATLNSFNCLPAELAERELERCCGAVSWCRLMVADRPYQDRQELHCSADLAFDKLNEADWLQAFAQHPKIGDLQSLRMKFVGNRDWSAGEQSGVDGVDESMIRELAELNAAYETKFGFIFIVCATGKSAGEMLRLLRARLPLDRASEMRNAALEQRKITHLRLDKWEVPT